MKDVDPHEFVAAYAKYLKRSGRVALPKNFDAIKTAFWKELAPSNPDWYYVRVASVARRIYMRNGVGVGWLSKAYSGAARRGCAPNRREFAARGTIRHAIQQLEKLKVIKKGKNGGRIVSSTGRRDLDRIASQLKNVRVKRVPVPAAAAATTAAAPVAAVAAPSK